MHRVRGAAAGEPAGTGDTVPRVDRRRIVALGGGGFSQEPDNPLLDAHILTLARRMPPRVCFLATASGDAATYVRDFYRAFSGADCVPSDLALFERRIADLRAFVLDQDVVYVGGGNTANMLAIWRVHGLDRVLTEAWHAGVVLCGISAGMNCWFQESVTDSFDLDALAALKDGLGLLPGSACPHYDGEEQRRPTYQRLVATGELDDGWAADEGAALVFAGEALEEVVTSRRDVAGYRVERTAEGAGERRLAARYLGAA
jgi:dipeptidase E